MLGLAWVLINDPPGTCQTLRTSAESQEAKVPFVPSTMFNTAAVPFVMVPTGLPVDACHSRIVPSELLEANRFPSCEKVTELTALV